MYTQSTWTDFCAVHKYSPPYPTEHSFCLRYCRLFNALLFSLFSLSLLSSSLSLLHLFYSTPNILPSHLSPLPPPPALGCMEVSSLLSSIISPAHFPFLSFAKSLLSSTSVRSWLRIDGAASGRVREFQDVPCVGAPIELFFSELAFFSSHCITSAPYKRWLGASAEIAFLIVELLLSSQLQQVQVAKKASTGQIPEISPTIDDLGRKLRALDQFGDCLYWMLMTTRWLFQQCIYMHNKTQFYGKWTSVVCTTARAD